MCILQYDERGKHVTKPYAKGVGSDNIQLEWETENELEQGHCFEIYYKIHNEGRWVQYLSETPCKLTRILIENLQPQTSYIFKIKIVSEKSEFEGPSSLLSDKITTKESAITNLLSTTKLICDTPIKQYQLPLTENKEARNELFKTRKYYIGLYNWEFYFKICNVKVV